MKKFITLILFFLCVVGSSNGQVQYKVKFVKDTVMLHEKLVKPGDVFFDTDSTLFFQNPDAFLYLCYSDCTKRRVVTGEKVKLANVKSVKEYDSYYKLLGSLREGKSPVLRTFEDFYVRRKVMLFDTIKLPFRGKKLKLDSSHYFYFNYTCDGKSINNKIDFVGNEIVISRSTFKTKKGGLYIPKGCPLSINYYDESSEISRSLTSNLELIFLDEDRLKELFKELIELPSLVAREKFFIIASVVEDLNLGVGFVYSDIVKILKE